MTAPAASLALVMLAAAASAAAAQDCALSVSEPSAPAAVEPAKDAPRIRAIRFEGQRAIGAGALGRRMEMKPKRFWRSSRRSLYSEDGWAADHRRLCDLFRERGHVTAAVGPPEVIPVGAGTGPAREVTLRIPVREGPAYRLRNVGLTGPPGSEAEAARERMDLRQGDLYRHGRLLEALGELRREAGRRGQATWSATVTLTPQPAAGVVDVTVSVNEGPAWSVGRIAFRGARRTRDGTLRRALALDEGERLDMEAVGTSTRRLEALGVVSIRDVEVVPSPRIAAAADVTFVLEERAVPRYGLSGGINALEGASIATQLGAANAFGRAERLLGSFQIGGDVRAWSLSAGLPFVFGTAWAAGLEAHAQRLELPGVPDGGVPPHVRDADGISLFATRPLGARGSLGLAWSLDDVSLTADTDPQPEGFGTRRERRLALSAGWDGWDHLWKPRRGLRTSAATRGWGGPLGGQVDAFEVQGRAFALVPLGRKAALGAGARAGFIHSPDGLAGLPFDDRYLLGGEGDLRGFDARTVGPRDAGGALVAGTRFVALQAEAHLDLPLGLRALAFLDAGNAWASEPDVTADGLRVSTGLELRFELPVLRLPLRLMGAFNPVRDPFHPRTAFRVALGPLP